MVDGQLVSELDAASRRFAGTARLPAEAAAEYVQGLVDAYVAEPSMLRWWESLKHSTTRVRYGETDGLAKLASILGDRADVRLVVTDEEAPPWPVYSGGVFQLIAMLRDCRFCEYIVAAPDMSWIVFDTHMNELVSHGLENCRAKSRLA